MEAGFLDYKNDANWRRRSAEEDQNKEEETIGPNEAVLDIVSNSSEVIEYAGPTDLWNGFGWGSDCYRYFGPTDLAVFPVWCDWHKPMRFVGPAYW